MKVLLTGATGFIGQYIYEELLNRYDEDNIVVLTSKNINKNNWIVAANYQYTGDIFVQNGCDDIDIVIHAGAYIPKQSSDVNLIENTSENIKTTQGLLLATLPNIHKFIFISTVDVYGKSETPITEKTSTNPLTMYGWSKLYCEKMVEAACRARGIQYQILRIGHVYGEGEDVYRKAMPEIIKRALKNQDILIYGNGNVLRTYIHVKDVARAIVNAVEGNVLDDNCVINVTGNEAITINQLAHMIAEKSGSLSKIYHLDAVGIEQNYIFDTKKLMTTILGNQRPFIEGLQEEIIFYRNKGW